MSSKLNDIREASTFRSQDSGLGHESRDGGHGSGVDGREEVGRRDPQSLRLVVLIVIKRGVIWQHTARCHHASLHLGRVRVLTLYV